MKYWMIFALLMGQSSWAIAAEQMGDRPFSAHEKAALFHKDSMPVLLEREFSTQDGALVPSAQERFTRTVYGYYPWWADIDQSIAWEALTHLSYFAVEVNADGSLGDDHGWAERGQALVAAGHEWGVAVTLTATLFDDEAIRDLLADENARAAAVENLYVLVTQAGGDGVNIDFEFVPTANADDTVSPRDNFVRFMTELAERFHGHDPSLHVSLATPAIDWGGTYDYSELARVSDGLMVMGYGYHWSGGEPGPVAPLRSSELWGPYSLEWTVEDYITWGGEENRNKVVLGIPLYGRDWPTSDLTVPGTAMGSGVAKSLSQCDTIFEPEKLWDMNSETPYRLYWDGEQAHQIFCEDLDSIRAKLALIDEYDLGGLMLWDVGKVSGTHGVWSEIITAYDVGDTSDTEVEGNQAPQAVLSFDDRVALGDYMVFDASESSDPDGDNLTYTWRQVAGAELALDINHDSLALALPLQVGLYEVEVEVSDGSLFHVARASVEVFEMSNEADESDLEGQPLADEDGCVGVLPNSGLWFLFSLLGGCWRKRWALRA